MYTLPLAPNAPLVMGYLLGNSLANLKAEHGIKTSAKVGDMFFSVNYDQIESKPGEMVNQCRGLILSVSEPLTAGQVSGKDPVGPTVIYARPFDRFFNLGDSNAASVNLDDSSTLFYEKLDGTCCIVWWNPLSNEWCVATRAVPLADKPMTGWDDLTFSGLFKKALRETLVNFNNEWEELAEKFNEDRLFQLWAGNNLLATQTYVFELTTPLNRIVVSYPEYTVWLLGIRNTQTGEELDIRDFGATAWGVPTCPSHRLNNLSELLTFVGSKAPFEQEGVVVCDNQFRRVKVKSLAYTAYNRVRDSAANSPRALVELILTEKLDDVLPILEPYVQEQAVKLQDGIRELFRTMETVYQEILVETEGQENKRKAFALGVQSRKVWMAPLMDRFVGRCSSLQDWIEKRKNSDGSYPDGVLEALIAASR
jgi:hypothetical protein